MRLQAIIFDLDDTLMDTYGQLVMRAHRGACLAMQQAGLPASLEEMLPVRLILLQEFPREDVNGLLAQHYGCQDPAVAQAGLDAYFNSEIKDIQLFPGAWELLAELQPLYRLFLVTAGSRATQEQKVAQLGIGRFFTEILYVDIYQPQQSKKIAFQDLMQRSRLTPDQTLVVGDRVHGEIRMANELGCPTVWMRHGEFAHVEPLDLAEEPDHTIEQIQQLKTILQTFKRKQSTAVS